MLREHCDSRDIDDLLDSVFFDYASTGLSFHLAKLTTPKDALEDHKRETLEDASEVDVVCFWRSVFLAGNAAKPFFVSENSSVGAAGFLERCFCSEAVRR